MALSPGERVRRYTIDQLIQLQQYRIEDGPKPEYDQFQKAIFDQREESLENLTKTHNLDGSKKPKKRKPRRIE
jgi:hypothetical protein